MNKKVTARQVAKAAGVSPTTVSRFFTGKAPVKAETHQRIVEAMNQLGYKYHPPVIYTQPLSTSVIAADSNDNTGFSLLLAIIPSFDNPFYSEVIKGADTAAFRHGYSLLSQEGQINEVTLPRLLETIQGLHISGIILFDHVSSFCLQQLAAVTQIVQCGEYSTEIDLPYVAVNDRAASVNAVENLISHGRKRIALISGTHNYNCNREREEGYFEALRAYNIDIRPEYIVHIPWQETDLAVSAVSQLLRLPECPNALFSTGDIYSLAALRACYLAKKNVPKDIAIIGFDNLYSCKITFPTLSSVNQPKIRLGFTAAEMLIERIKAPDTPVQHILLDTELIIRESSTF